MADCFIILTVTVGIVGSMKCFQGDLKTVGLSPFL